MIYLKINRTELSEIIAVCDEELIGKSFSENNLKLDVTERFYKGKLMNEEEIIEKLKNARNINIVGKNSINLAIKHRIIDKDSVIKIKNIPHAVIFEL